MKLSCWSAGLPSMNVLKVIDDVACTEFKCPRSTVPGSSVKVERAMRRVSSRIVWGTNQTPPSVNRDYRHRFTSGSARSALLK
jgi:hypothetical protein